MGKKTVDVLGLERQVLTCSIKAEAKISKSCSVLLSCGHSNKERAMNSSPEWGANALFLDNGLKSRLY